MNSGQQQKSKSVMERHIHTVLLSIITAGILFGGNQIFNLSIAVARIQVSIEQIMQDKGKYVTVDFMLERSKARDNQLIEIDKRITRVENKLEKMNGGM